MIKITEIFYSFQGESSFIGRPTTFIRLSGCNLKCKICDTPHAFTKSKKISIKEIITIIKPIKTPYVCITGGEPLAQKKGLKKLISELKKLKKIISIETNGSIEIPTHKTTKYVIDVKTPSTEYQNSFKIKNLKKLKKQDELKFIISDHTDYEFAREFIKKNKIKKNLIILSPNMDKNNKFANELINWILQDNLNVMFQPQLHKLIPEKPIFLL
jgi:7-carboxy-7-deazaguanine synthase